MLFCFYPLSAPPPLVVFSAADALVIISVSLPVIVYTYVFI